MYLKRSLVHKNKNCIGKTGRLIELETARFFISHFNRRLRKVCLVEFVSLADVYLMFYIERQ